MGCLCRLDQDSNAQDAQTAQLHSSSAFPVPTLSGETAYYRLFYAYDEVSFFVFSVGLDKRSLAVISG